MSAPPLSDPNGTAFVVDPAAPRRFSMSFLRSAEGCLRRAHLDRAASIPSDGDALVGTLFHECAATIGFATAMRGGSSPTVDEAVSIARKVLRRPERVGPMPRDAHRTVLELVQRWATRGSMSFRAGEVFEILSTQPLNGRTLSARLDRYWLDGSTLEVIDYKTGWADPAHGLTMQGEIYAWHGFEREPGLELVVYSEDHVRMGVRAGPFEITREQVYGPDGIEQFMLDALARIDDAYARGGDLPPTPGSSCSSPSRCPHAKSCPIPEWARPDTTVESEPAALELFGSLLVQEQRRAADTKALRGWLAHDGRRALALNGEEIGMADKPGQTLDRKRLAADLAAGADVRGLDEYMKPTNPTFGRRKAKGNQ